MNSLTLCPFLFLTFATNYPLFITRYFLLPKDWIPDQKTSGMTKVRVAGLSLLE
jgi:hypothetical protein